MGGGKGEAGRERNGDIDTHIHTHTLNCATSSSCRGGLICCKHRSASIISSICRCDKGLKKGGVDEDEEGRGRRRRNADDLMWEDGGEEGKKRTVAPV